MATPRKSAVRYKARREPPSVRPQVRVDKKLRGVALFVAVCAGCMVVALGLLARRAGDFPAQALFSSPPPSWAPPLVFMAVGAVFAWAVYGLLSRRLMNTLRSAHGSLTHQATHDALTGLPNRALFMHRLGEAIARTRPGLGFTAVMFMDLDDFKGINDSRGHEVGDAVLRHVADVLRQAVPALYDTARAGATSPITRKPGWAIARLGGDEFTIVVEGLASESAVRRLGEGLLKAISEPTRIDDETMVVRSSIGIALNASASIGKDDLLRQADMALYKAKARPDGEHHLAFYDEQMAQLLKDRIALEKALSGAAAHVEMRLLYQPCVSPHDGQMQGISARLHWLQPGRGLIAMAAYGDALQESSCATEIGRWLVDTACQQLARWDTETRRVQYLAVPMTRSQLIDPALPAHLEAALRRHGIRANRLRIDLDHEVMGDALGACTAAQKRLAELGVGFGAAGIGWGTAALDSLVRPGLRALIVAPDLVRRAPQSAESRKLLTGLAAVASGLGLQLVCEGTDTEAHVDCLRRIMRTAADASSPARQEPGGTLTATGKLFGRPQAAAELALPPPHAMAGSALPA